VQHFLWMAQCDVDVIRRFYAAWTASDLPGMLALADPHIEAQPVLGLLYKRPSYRGHHGITQWFEEIDDLWDDFEPRIEDTREVDGSVVAFLHVVTHTRGRMSDARIAVVCKVQDGKIVSMRGRDRDELAEELGLDV
jgi:ketosteroid isomerase-like protein